MKKNRNNKCFCRTVIAASLAAIFLTGCGSQIPSQPMAGFDGGYTQYGKAEDVTVPNVTQIPQETLAADDVFVGMYKADEEILMLDEYTGSLVFDAGAEYAKPVVNMAGSEAVNDKISEVYNKIYHTGSYSDEDKELVKFNVYGNVELRDADDKHEIVAVYEQYTGQLLTPEEYNHLVFGEKGTTEAAINAMLVFAEQEYVDMAMYNDQLSPEGLQLTLELAKEKYYSDCFSFLDASGNEVFHNYNFETDFRGDYYYENLAYFGYGRNDIPYLNGINLPATDVIKDKMLATIEKFDQEKEGPVLCCNAGVYIAGRYAVYAMELYDECVTEYHYFFLNLLTGQEESYEQVYANMGLDKTILNEKINKLVDEDYRERYQNMTGTPFDWEHNEELYARTMAEANADGVKIIPGSEIAIVYNAYMTEDGKPVQRVVGLPELGWKTRDESGDFVDMDMSMYVGLEDLLKEHFAAEAKVGYVNYGTWQWDDVVVISVGWYDAQMNWMGYETVCFNATTGELVEFEDVLASSLVSEWAFENEFRMYLQSKSDFPGLNN